MNLAARCGVLIYMRGSNIRGGDGGSAGGRETLAPMDSNSKLSYIACDVPEGMTLEQWRARPPRPRRGRPWRKAAQTRPDTNAARTPR